VRHRQSPASSHSGDNQGDEVEGNGKEGEASGGEERGMGGNGMARQGRGEDGSIFSFCSAHTSSRILKLMSIMFMLDEF